MPFLGKQFEFAQPDGTKVQVRGWGDQYRAVFRTLDGEPVARNPHTGFYEYAAIDQGNRLRPLGLRAGIDARPATPLSTRPFTPAEAKALIISNPGLPETTTRWRVRSDRKRRMARVGTPGVLLAPPSRQTVGTFVGLCILIEFPNVPGTIAPDEVDRFLNQPGYTGFGNAGSVRDYFRDVSNGKLDYTSIVTPCITAQHPRSYYTDESIPQPERAWELIGEALVSLQAQGFDFTRLTADDEEYIYAINVYHAGPRVNNWARGLWPHAYHLEQPVQVHPGFKAFDYQFTDIGDELTLGTFCHENGHMICDFPDLYDYGYESAGSGRYCLMCSGGNADPKNPAQVGAYLKYRAGWADTVTQIRPGNAYRIDAPGNHFCTFTKSQQEYFILEHRRNTGRDAALPGSGLAIWHVDELGKNDHEVGTPELHYECALVQADGKFDLEHDKNDGDQLDLFPSGGKTSFSDATIPNTRWWDGASSGLSINQITLAANAVTFAT